MNKKNMMYSSGVHMTETKMGWYMHAMHGDVVMTTTRRMMVIFGTLQKSKTKWKQQAICGACVPLALALALALALL